MTYKNCDDAFAHNDANIPQGDPSYAAHLDGRPGQPNEPDGIACESKTISHKVKVAAPVPQKKSPVVTKTQTSVAQPQATLPVTGTGTTYGAIAFALMSIGVICLLAVKRRRISWRSE